RAADGPIYEDEVVELFLDADGDGRTYHELEVSPAGTTFDAAFEAPRRGMDLGWASGLASAVAVDGTLDDPAPDRGLTVELSVPWRSLRDLPHPPRAGDEL